MSAMVKKTGRPGYLQIADELRERIRGGLLAPGEPLPSTAQLAEQFDASLSVVKMAVGILRNEGLVVGQQGKGVFVCEDGQPAQDADLRAEVTALRSAVQNLTRRLEQIEAALPAADPKASD
ncbi:winged helix-turn-helix domain-containing protein [Acrocarpospora catenulata]|uniref:winged helix-turn-helix domain-containing protein n=1 Tax=Acrocarpospora catenulata TaxID=2836182 RepID=UPI002023B098|nr:winged helix-turn-helix domain-containing protein [Acrocarpospora catenulata]